MDVNTQFNKTVSSTMLIAFLAIIFLLRESLILGLPSTRHSTENTFFEIEKTIF